MPAQNNIAARDRSQMTNEEIRDQIESETWAQFEAFAKIFFSILCLVLACMMPYREFMEVRAEWPASPGAIASVSAQVKATDWDKCHVGFDPDYTPRTYLDTRLKSGKPVKNSSLDRLRDAVNECKAEIKQKEADALNVKAQKAALN